jgi:hypothetical protein
MRVLIVQCEPGGMPILTALVDPELTDVDHDLLKLASSPTHEKHAGAVASYLCCKYRSCVRSIPLPSDEPYTDSFVQSECERSKYCLFPSAVIRTDGASHVDSTGLYEEMEQFIKDVQADPDKGQTAESWKQARASTILEKYFPDETVADRLADKAFLVDKDREFDPEEVDEKTTRVIFAPLFHTYWTTNEPGEEKARYDGIATIDKQLSWMRIVGVEPSDLESWRRDSTEDDDEGPTRANEWEVEEANGVKQLCHDECSRVPIFFPPSKCPPTGTTGLGLRQDPDRCMAADDEQPSPKTPRKKSKARMDIVTEFRVGEDFVQGKRPWEDEWQRLAPVAHWPELGILVLSVSSQTTAQ